MSDKQHGEPWTPSPDRAKRLQELRLAPQQFAAISGANASFAPAHSEQWMLFWQTDICEKDEYHTWFPKLSLADAQRVWMAIEEQFLSRYEYFLRVWPEWCSSGIWSVPYPGSRVAGGMVDYQYLPLPSELVGRFKAWQEEYDHSSPVGSHELDWDRFSQTAEELARDLKRQVGPRIYVE